MNHHHQKENQLSLDPYQERYLEHQERKQRTIKSEDESFRFKPMSPMTVGTFKNLIRNRHSHRKFHDKIDLRKIKMILDLIINTPTSCNRQGINLYVCSKDEDISFIEKYLVGGKGWIHNAKTVILFFADMLCYKSPAEKEFMPFLDTGFYGMNLYYACSATNLGGCFINPNIQENNKKEFLDKFKKKDQELFTGAFAMGEMLGEVRSSPKKSNNFLKIENEKNQFRM